MLNGVAIRSTFVVHVQSAERGVSWEVKADRNDRFVQKYLPRDVVDKQGEEIGKYLRPELYNPAPERGMHCDPRRDEPQMAKAPAAKLRSASAKR